MIRISGGKFKGQTLKAPKGKGTRPTSAARREALFNILHNGMGIESERVLDLFAGTGALGLEALSRGAVGCVFVEAAPEALVCLRDNIQTLSLSAEQAQVLATNRIKEWGARLNRLAYGAPFDLILCDPPYEQGLGLRALKQLNSYPDLFSPEATLVLELAVREEIPQLEGWDFIKERAHGQGRLTIYTRKS